jgi:hypothetical protein
MPKLQWCTDADEHIFADVFVFATKLPANTLPAWRGNPQQLIPPTDI